MKYLDLLDRVLVLIASGALIIMTLLTTISVFGRYLFNSPIPDDLVMSEFLMVFLVFLPQAAVQAAREHVFVTLFTDWMSNNTKVILETIGVAVGAIIFTIIALAAFDDFYRAWSVGAYVEGQLKLPEFPPRFIVFFGLAVFAVRLVIDLIQSIISIAQGTAQATLSEEDRILQREIHQE